MSVRFKSARVSKKAFKHSCTVECGNRLHAGVRAKKFSRLAKGLSLPEGAFSTFLLLGVCVSNSCSGDSTDPPKSLDRTKGASPRSTSKPKSTL